MDLRRYYRDKPNFRPYEKGGATLCTITFDSGKSFQGIAICSMSEQFCYARGRKIAYGRALKEVIKYENNTR